MVSVEDAQKATLQIAQTTLRSVLGKADLDTLLSERERLNEDLQQIIDEQTEPWGIKATTVEIKDVSIPAAMQQAMSRQAEAERERRAQIINAEGEFQAAAKLARGGGGDQRARRPRCSCATCRRCARSPAASSPRRSSSRSRSTSSSRCWSRSTSRQPTRRRAAELHNGAGVGELPKPQ